MAVAPDGQLTEVRPRYPDYPLPPEMVECVRRVLADLVLPRLAGRTMPRT